MYLRVAPVMKRVYEQRGNRPIRNLGMDTALQKAREFCAYQERSHAEVKDKLYGFGLQTEEVHELMAQLISENFLNEERYAIAFAGGKFRMKGWGKAKIKQALKQHSVSDYCIKLALSEINADDYWAKLQKIAESKWALLSKEKNAFVKQAKLKTFLMQKGYESSLVHEVVKLLQNEEKE